MAKIELTDHYIRRLSVDVRTDIADTREPGLTLRITPTGSKSWAVRCRSADGTSQRVTLGQYPDISLKDARSKAAIAKADIRNTAGNLNQVRREAALAASADPTLGQLIEEYESGPGTLKVTWTRSKRNMHSESRNRVETVFAALLERRVSDITDDNFSDTMTDYTPLSGAEKANGQVSRARANLMTVLDWAAGRSRFRTAGKRRKPTVNVVDLRDTYDPAADDEAITGKRDRVLSVDELKVVLPFLAYPAPASLKMRMKSDEDVRPMALRFILLTCARLNEVVVAKWRHVDFDARTWHKPVVKSVRGGTRSQTLPIPDAALELLASLPGYGGRADDPDGLVFPSSYGTELENWERITGAIMRESQTASWHRHDLRRTSATIMRAVGIDLSTIDRILGHKTAYRREETSSALDAYLSDIALDDIAEDPQRSALEKLADVYKRIERRPETPVG